MTKYFIVYSYSSGKSEPFICETVETEHPVLWLLRVRKVAEEAFEKNETPVLHQYHILFWAEIPDEVATTVGEEFE